MSPDKEIQKINQEDTGKKMNAEEKKTEEKAQTDTNVTHVTPSKRQADTKEGVIDVDHPTEGVWKVRYAYMSVLWKNHKGTLMESVLILLHTSALFKFGW